MDHELEDLVGPVVATVMFDQSIDGGFQLKQFGS